MDKIVSFINENSNNRFKDLLFFDAVLEREKDTLILNFKTQKGLKINKNDKTEILNLCKNYFKNYNFKIEINIKNECLTMAEFKEIVKKTIDNKLEMPPININYIFEKEIVKVTIDLFESYVDDVILTNIKNELENEILELTGSVIEVDFRFNNAGADVLNARKEKLVEDNKIFEVLNGNKMVKLENIEVLFGNFNATEACLAGCSLDGNSSICVVGSVKSVLEKESKTKSGDAENEKKDAKKYYVIELEHENETTKIMWFFSNKEEKPHAPSLGSIIAIDCSVTEFNGFKNIRAKSLAKCTYVPPKEVFRDCPKQYSVIKPEKYEFFEQANFFQQLEKTKNEYLLNNTFVVYDLETTGVSSDRDKIIDIGAFKIVNGEIVEKFSTFVNPEMPIPPDATKINKITNEMVADSPTIESVFGDFYKFCYGSIIVGYNNNGFDDLFIQKVAKKLMYKFDNKRDDVFNLAKKHLFGLKNYKLGTVCEHMGVSLIDAHRATNDALATAKLFIKIVEKFI